MRGRRRLRRWVTVRLAAALVGVGLVAACDPGSAGRSAGPPSSRPAGAAGGFVRTCESSVYGELGDGWRRDSVVAGPLAFVALRAAAAWPAGELRRRAGGYRGQKVLVVVAAGETVTVTVPVAERRHLSLLYDPSAWSNQNLYRVTDGDPA
jgi:hypothetical protein